jgi:hypothetical protein
MHTNFQLKPLKGYNHLGERDVNGSKILKFIFKIEKKYEGLSWIQLANDRVKWRATVSTVMILEFP